MYSRGRCFTSIGYVWSDECQHDCAGPDDGLSDEPVFELRFTLIFRPSDVLAAEDTREDCREGTDGYCGVFAARESRDRGRIAGHWLAAFSASDLKDLGGKKGVGFGVGKIVGVPTPGRPTPWVLHASGERVARGR